MVVFSPALPPTRSAGDVHHIPDHNAIVAALHELNAGKLEIGGGGEYAQASAVVVASSAASTATKSVADYVCDGTADQVEINAALVKASRPGDGFGGDGRIRVQLAGSTFNISSPILLPANVTLSGNGRGTLIQPPSTSDSQDVGAIQLLNTNCHGITIESLTIGRLGASKTNWDMIRLVGAADGNTYEIYTGNDSFATIRDVLTLDTNGKGIQVGGVGGANGYRESQIHDCIIWNSQDYGIHVWGGSDAKVRDCVVGGGNNHGIVLGSGNTAVSNCKVYYRGNFSGGVAASHGFYVSSSRCRIVGCEAQDNAGYGFYITGDDVVMSGCHSDSNGAGGSGGGYYIDAHGTYSGMNATTRGQNAIEQDTGIVFANSPNVMLTGRVKVDAGISHVSGTPGAGSFVRVTKYGGTVGTNPYAYDGS